MTVSYDSLVKELCCYYAEKHPDDFASAIVEVQDKIDCLLTTVDGRQAIRSEIEENIIEWNRDDIKDVDWFVIMRKVKKCLERKADGTTGGTGLFTFKRNRLRH